MSVVITYGTFDVLHRGHVNLLRRAKELGDYLFVGLSTDDFNRSKGKFAHQSYEDRKYILESVRYVDYVFPEYSWEQKLSDINRFSARYFVMGGDWRGRFDYLSPSCGVIYFDRTPEVSSSSIRADISRKSRR